MCIRDSHQQVGDTLVRMNDNTSHIKVKLDELDRSIGELKTAVEDIQSDGDYPTENRVQEMISDNLEDHDVSCQIDEALDNRDYLGRDEVENTLTNASSTTPMTYRRSLILRRRSAINSATSIGVMLCTTKT